MAYSVNLQEIRRSEQNLEPEEIFTLLTLYFAFLYKQTYFNENTLVTQDKSHTASTPQ